MKIRSILFGFTLFVILISALSAFFLITYFFFFRPFQVAGDSMAPKYTKGQYILARKIAYNAPQRGDAIVLHAPLDPNKDIIKRVIGLPGDTLSIKSGDVYLNNNKLDENSYLKSGEKTYGGTFLKEEQSVTVPENQYFILGDNRPFSADSREFGFIKKESIIGKIEFCYYNCN